MYVYVRICRAGKEGWTRALTVPSFRRTEGGGVGISMYMLMCVALCVQGNIYNRVEGVCEYDNAGYIQ
jgi:hypothetical protein